MEEHLGIIEPLELTKLKERAINMQKNTDTLRKYILESSYIVFFGGAGVSTESGIPDFRSVDGLYNQQYKHPPETILSRRFFMSNTDEFYEFYRNKLLCLDAQPNKAHIKLAKLEKSGKLKAVITQNIDGLHQKAGSKNVLELHGSVYSNFCVKCGLNHDVSLIKNCEGVPHCKCGGVIKPDVVLFGETLNEHTINSAFRHISNADLLIIGGTSLGVYPAAGLIDYYQGNKLVLINKSSTHVDRKANLVINESIGKVFENCLQ